MKLPRLLKLPKLKLPRVAPSPKKLDARVRTGAAPMIDDYDQDEPQTKLSSAFIVVLLLHAVAVGGIYAFNSIKASRRAQEPPHATTPGAAKGNSAASTAGASETERSAPPSTPPTPPASTASRARSYSVKSGDNLTGIAKQFGVSVADLESANGLKPAATLRIAQTLNIPSKGNVARSSDIAKAEPRTGASAEAKSAPQAYTVKSGDRLLFIAKRFNVSPEELVALNKLKDPGKLQIGQTLKIPPKKSP